MHILYLDLDTLRPDHLGCYGYPRNTSPNLDSVAAAGCRFNQVYCSDAPCLPSRSALMSGRFGFNTGVVGHGGTAADPHLEGAKRDFTSTLGQTSLPAVLKQSGLHTAYIGGFGERHSAWWFYAGFREIHDSGLGGLESAEDVTPLALDWIQRNADAENWYLHINYWDPHTPYRAPRDFGNPFADDPFPGWMTPELLIQHQSLPGPHSAQEVNMYDSSVDPRFPRQPGSVADMVDWRKMIDGYDCGIAYLDQHLGQLFTALQQAGIWDDLAIIISSDHGENLGELGMYAEHGTADALTCRIPLIIRWPGKKSGQIDNDLHYHLDLAPSLTDLLNLDSPEIWDGKRFSSALGGHPGTGREYLVLGQGAHVCQRAVRWSDYIYIRTWHDGFHLFPEEMLFNLTADPHEQINLAAQQQTQCETAAQLMGQWCQSHLDKLPEAKRSDPFDTVIREGGPYHARGQLPAYLRRLNSTGRGEHETELRRRHPQEFNRKD